jgi:hypothetical protein
MVVNNKEVTQNILRARNSLIGKRKCISELG